MPKHPGRLSKPFPRVIDRPVIRLVSVDLDAAAEIRSLNELFDFGHDYLGRLKAAAIAASLPRGNLKRLPSQIIYSRTGAEILAVRLGRKIELS
jgi:hypothetical protein